MRINVTFQLQQHPFLDAGIWGVTRIQAGPPQKNQSEKQNSNQKYIQTGPRKKPTTGTVLGWFKNKQHYGNHVTERILDWTSSQKSLSAMVENRR
jgi:hypothetical protein